ncbi:hypothetical protein BDY19DRAFT_901425 [Irpex rosettiformis]|uniref:Uncharacterized protein n=1 Tax=Irpex rosettiformis TaxID=378272 RepID=A0ACB8UIM0_9APHY|nr:hypothetical protein BDY19DRAFT_901425 [Irpex rosettiformis]
MMQILVTYQTEDHEESGDTEANLDLAGIISQYIDSFYGPRENRNAYQVDHSAWDSLQEYLLPPTSPDIDTDTTDTEDDASADAPDVTQPFFCLEQLSKTGATIPPDLFDNILFYVDRRSPRSARKPKSKGYKRLKRHQSTDVAHSLKACSLVCRHWANRCRQNTFSGAELVISSAEDAEIFRTYATRGCSSLLPVHKLIERISVEQSYSAPRSFCHILYPLWPLLGDHVKYTSLKLTGPIPDKFPRVFLDSPHWSFAPSAVISPLLPRYYHRISVSKVHLPSFAHVVRYTKHLKHAQQVEFTEFTWEVADRDRDPLRRFPRTTMPREPLAHRMSLSIRNCTDNIRLCPHMAVTCTNFWLHWLSPAAYWWVLSLVALLKESYVEDDNANPQCFMHGLEATLKEPPALTLSLQPQRTQFNSIAGTDYELVIDDQSLIGPMPIDRILGFAVICSSRKTNPVNLDELVTHLRSLQMPLAIVVVFRGYGNLQAYAEGFRPVAFNPAEGDGPYVFACKRSEISPFHDVPSAGEDDFVGIDPITLGSTVQSWETQRDIIPSLLRCKYYIISTAPTMDYNGNRQEYIRTVQLGHARLSIATGLIGVESTCSQAQCSKPSLSRKVETELFIKSSKDTTPHIHSATNAIIGNSRLSKLQIVGPLPDGFPLTTPYCQGTLLSTASPPSLLPYQDIMVENLHLPSSLNAAK